MTIDKVTFGRVVSAAIETSNSADSSRRYGITAMADTSEGKVTNIHQGVVTDIETNSHLADFRSDNGAGGLTLTYSGAATDRVAILEEVESYMEATMGQKITITVTD